MYKEIIIDGNCFEDWEGFYDEVELKFMDEATRIEYQGNPYPVGRNLNAFIDFLRGGFGMHEYGEPLHIKWINFDKSVIELGKKEMDYIVSIILDDYDSSYNCTFEKA